MPRRKQARRMTVQDIRTILRLTHDQGLSVREIALRLKLSKTTVSTYLLREPRRVCRRLQLLSRMEHHEQDNEQIFP